MMLSDIVPNPDTWKLPNLAQCEWSRKMTQYNCSCDRRYRAGKTFQELHCVAQYQRLWKV